MRLNVESLCGVAMGLWRLARWLLLSLSSCHASCLCSRSPSADKLRRWDPAPVDLASTSNAFARNWVLTGQVRTRSFSITVHRPARGRAPLECGHAAACLPEGAGC